MHEYLRRSDSAYKENHEVSHLAALPQEYSDVVCAHPAILSADGVTIHAALIVATKQPVYVELNKISSLLRLGNQRSNH